ncbi:MAG: GNAT family N-acetyltransferase [Bacteroidales bacterium]|nr:GNAT family N-acetyltransferase [Bacteroidales bacterium]MDD3665242.1 GNAT family N-acetyltransferase [Bacteroidales bacterium]
MNPDRVQCRTTNQLNDVAITNLEGVSFEVIHGAFRDAFSDYAEPFDMSVDDLQYMIQRRGYNPVLSFGARAGSRLVGFILNGTGMWQGQFTAYDTGTGMVQEYRKRGLASRLFSESLPHLKRAGISRYLLEVIRTNTGAFDLYRKAGFEVSRWFEYYRMNCADVPEPVETDFLVKPITLSEALEFRSIDAFMPSWQNSPDALLRKKDYLKCLAAVNRGVTTGVVVVEPHTGDIPLLLVDNGNRKMGVGTQLFRSVVKLITTPGVKIINVPSVETPFNQWALKVGLKPGFGQFEMVKQL